jgi:membrane fusion protein, heavy metal efflux system
MHSTVTAALFSLALAIFSLGSGAVAHEGEDHGTADMARPQAAASPRVEDASDQFELVVTARRGELTIFLDRFATNAPVANAKIAVETPSGSIDAVAAAGETYRLPAPWSHAPGRYDLIVTVVADGAADVFPLTLTVPDRSPASASASSSLLTSAALAGGLTNRIASNDLLALAAGIAGFLLGVGTAMLARRRSRPAALGLAFLSVGSLVAAPERAGTHEGDRTMTRAWSLT